MTELIKNMVPVLLLLGFGAVLRHIRFFDEPTVVSLNRFVSRILLPCVIFNSIYTMDIHTEHLWISICFFGFMCVVLALNYAVFKMLRLKRTFFVFFSAAFSFGLSGIPLFTTAFGAEHMDYLVAMGIGHELFFAVVYLTVAQILLKNEPVSLKSTVKNLFSPLFFMVLLALILNLTGFRSIINANVAGSCAVLFIQKLASITTVLTMIVIGYRLSFSDIRKLKESFLIVIYRYATVLPLGLLYKKLVMDRLVTPVPDLDRAFWTMLSLFGSTMLIVLVGQYASKEDTEACSNAFVINVLVSFPVFLLLASIIG